ncbi:28S ribosomal protein S28, mitochondrial [Aplysia californica]|uniref:28S ribosomal protein S28, mitochondrial n=1 Tax=Aplysia californica TaxID=6500 RepID=A0ABM0JWP4_APLCA|nr:28S ribosomal protein S28, mitochondrial [Aplysia californica]
MAASLVRRVLYSPPTTLVYQRFLGSRKLFHTSEDNSDKSNHSSSTPGEEALDKFAKVVEKVKQAQQNEGNVSSASTAESQSPTTAADPTESFASMLRKSKLVSLGEYKDRLVEGKIIEVMEDDLYIDYGGKFHCVCPRPKWNGEKYKRGTKVLLSLQCLEMSSAFLGSDIHVTLLEGDATLLGLRTSRKSNTNRSPQTQVSSVQAARSSHST